MEVEERRVVGVAVSGLLCAVVVAPLVVWITDATVLEGAAIGVACGILGPLFGYAVGSMPSGRDDHYR